ncbi:hypothetical protein ACIA03_29780 [Nocardioides sp. NPDC051685]|uniref:hypothetical protein n=1 Tax=Nocardioides sp. NPDC051685 TaxID=3364334 RepID=UPI003793A7A4
MVPDESDSTGSAVREVGSKAIAAMVGASVGGVPGAVVAVALEPIFIELAARSWDELSDVRRRSAGLMIQRASQSLRVGPADVTDAAFTTDAKSQLFAEALQAAAFTANQSKIDALGRALANGLAGDGARVDEERLIVAGLSGLEEPHIRVLVNLPRQRPRPMTTPTSSARGAGGRRGALLAAVAERAGLSTKGAINVMAELVRTGMASQDGYGSEQRHDRLIIELQDEVAKLQWIVDNLGKRPPSNRRPKALKKPGSPIESGYGRTQFGDQCLEYLEVSAPDIEYPEVAEDDRPDLDV